MTPRERANMAEQLLANPLFSELFDKVEKTATEAMIYASDDETRAENASRVQAIRTMRRDCEASLRNTDARRAAPA